MHGHILPEFDDASSTPKDKRAFQKAPQHLCAESQHADSQYGKKITIKK